MTEAGLDWLTLSLPGSYENRERLQKLVGNRLFSHGVLSVGQRGYEGMDLANSGSFMWRRARHGGNDYLITLPGSALEFIRDALHISIPDLLRDFLELGWRVTRLDLAVDCRDTTVNPERVYRHLCRGNVVCRAADKNAVIGKSKIGQPGPADGKGMTVYIGSRQSSRFMRVYDKQTQMLDKAGRDVGHCTRFELEIKGEAATLIAKQIAANGESIIGAVLNGWIDFKSARGPKQLAKRKSVAWWARLVQTGSKITPRLQRGMATPEKSFRWQEDQWRQTLALTLKYCPDQINRLARSAKVDPRVVDRWERRFRPGQERLFPFAMPSVDTDLLAMPRWT